MTDLNSTDAASLATAAPTKPEKKEDSFFVFLAKLVVVVLVFRTLVFTSFSIPSESMMPTLLKGDYLFAAKWPYGYSQASLPFDIPVGEGRLMGSVPEAGDVVIFKHPVDRTDYVKRVVGVPGDQVQMIGGVLHLNGEAVKRTAMPDYVQPILPNEGCSQARFTTKLADGSFACSYPRFQETLPNGVTYETLDFGLTMQDTTEAVIVPEDNLFLMGDNRDNSQDSRFPAIAGAGVAMVPVDNVVGKASFLFFSTDGTAEILKPWTWFTAARWDRVGNGI